MMMSPALIIGANMSPAAAASVAATLPIASAALLGVAVGVCAGAFAEMKLQEFEEKCRLGTYKVRWRTAQGLRLLLVGTGTGLTVAAACGVISASIVITAGVASCGVALAIIGVLAIGAGMVRYKNLQESMSRQERADACDVLLRTMGSLDDAQVRMFVQQHTLTLTDAAPFLANLNEALAVQNFARLHRAMQ